MDIRLPKPRTTTSGDPEFPRAPSHYEKEAGKAGKTGIGESPTSPISPPKNSNERGTIENGAEIVIEPAHPNAKPTYFKDVYGRIVGPVIPEFLAKADGYFWIVTTFDGEARWIRSDRLRSQKAFETPKPVIISAPIPREPVAFEKDAQASFSKPKHRAVGLRDLLDFVQEREEMRKRKESGAAPPWTTDPILAKYRFTNVRRAHDRVSRWILHHIIAPYREHPNLWLMLAIARWVNWPPTLQELMDEQAWPIEEPNWAHMAAVVDARTASGEKGWTAAYMIHGESDPASPYYKTGKGREVFCGFLAETWAQRERLLTAIRTNRQSAVHRVLTECRCWGPFMSGQVAADLTWTPLLSNAEDLYSWSPQGPGSCRGLNRILNRPLTSPFGDAEWQTRLQGLRADIIKELGTEFADLTLVDVQSSLCEIDKFLRVKHGEGQPKALYRPETAY